MPLYFDINFLKGAAVYGDDFVHTTVFCLNFKMTKSKVRQLILVAGGNIKEIVARHLAAAHGNMVGVRYGHVFSVLQIKKLCPRIYI